MYRNLIKMKAKADRNLTNGGTIKAKVKEERKRPQSLKSGEDVDMVRPAKILKVSRKEKPSEPEEKENTPSNGHLNVSQINKAVFVVFKKIQASPLTQKIINSLVVLLREDTNVEQVGALQGT